MNRKTMLDVEGLLWSCVEGDGEKATRVLKRISEADLARAAVGGWRMWVAAVNLLPPAAAQEVMRQLKENEMEGAASDAGGMVGGDSVVGDSDSVGGAGVQLAGPDLAQFGTVVKGPEALNAIRQVGAIGLEPGGGGDQAEN